MNKNILLALPIFLLLNFLAVSESPSRFIDTASLLIVLGVAISFALCGSGSWFSVSRLSNAAEGAVIAGWLGALYGSVMILGNFDEQFIEWIGPACAVMALTVVYGYCVRALCRLVILSRESESF
jgi:ribose/xylose/arabinose/galactoside ABC-type transport system permease subunit